MLGGVGALVAHGSQRGVQVTNLARRTPRCVFEPEPARPAARLLSKITDQFTNHKRASADPRNVRPAAEDPHGDPADQRR